MRTYDGCATVLYRATKMIQSNSVSPIKLVGIDLVGTYCEMRMQGMRLLIGDKTAEMCLILSEPYVL